MKKRTPRHRAPMIGATTLATFVLGMMLAVLVAGSASAKTPPKHSPKGPAPASQTGSLTTTTTPQGADAFSVINGTVNAASDHEIVGSSAFPNFTTGAVDNYYTMSHAHVDNSPFAEGTASPFDTGPIGQTAAAGNFQQPQYADARWPGGPAKSQYGSQGAPFAATAADNNRAKADAAEPSNGLSGPGLHGTRTLAVPPGFDARLRQALAGWSSTYNRVVPKKQAPTVTAPRAPVTVPSSPVTPPSLPKAPVTVPGAPKLPSAGAMGPTTPTRSPAAVTTPRPPSLPKPHGSPSGPSDGESLLTSSTLATLVYKTDKTDTPETNTCKTDTVGTTGAGTTTTATTTTTDATKKKSGTCELVTSGESSMGKVVLGGGQIVIEGIHVTASITNDGSNPTYKAKVTVASASIGGIPVTIDESGVHVAGQGQGLPYKQASDALNTALKQAGIQIFLVQPEVTSCQGGTGTSSGGSTNTTQTTTTTSTTSTDQSGGTGACGQTGPTTGTCDQSGSGSGSGGAPGLPGQTTTQSNTDTTTTPSSCGQTAPSGTCDQSGTGTGSGTTTTTGSTTTATPTPTPPTQTTTNQSTTTTTSGSSCSKAGAPTGTTTSSNDQSATTTPSGSNGTFQFGPGPGTNNAGETTVTATGVHIVFTQPTSPPGVPAQFVEHILGEVFVDSIAAPFAPLPAGGLGFSAGSSFSPSTSCGGGHLGSSASRSGLSASGGGSSIAGSAGSAGSAGGGLSASGSALGSSSQPASGTTGTTGGSVPASFARALKKPLWLLLAYVVWQLLVIGTGWSLWNWRRGGAS